MILKKIQPFFLVNAGPVLDFLSPSTPPLTPFIALVTVNKLQENYFSIGAQCFPYLTVTAVTYTDALI